MPFALWPYLPRAVGCLQNRLLDPATLLTSLPTHYKIVLPFKMHMVGTLAEYVHILVQCDGT